MFRPFQQSYHIPGTLGANISIVFKVPFNCHLFHISAVASNDSDAKIAVTNNSSTTYLTAATIGDSGVPKVFTAASFDAGVAPKFSKGGAVAVTLDFDGASGTAAHDVTIVLTFEEG
jgi:hypothetical protein